jgi:hypothetical protein
MERMKVLSSIIRTVGYDEQTRLLEVEFNDKKVGRFINIPPETYDRMMKAQSVGKFFIQNIRDRYPANVSGIKKKRHTLN